MVTEDEDGSKGPEAMKGRTYGPEVFYWKSLDALLAMDNMDRLDIARKILTDVIDKQQKTAMIEYWHDMLLPYLMERCAVMRMTVEKDDANVGALKRVALELMLYGKDLSDEQRQRFANDYSWKSIKNIRRAFEQPGRDMTLWHR